MSNPHVPIVSDQERELIWIDVPDSGLALTDADRAYADGVVAGVAVERHRHRKRDRLDVVFAVAVTVALLVAAFAAGRASAAPRSAQPVIPAAIDRASRGIEGPASGNPAGQIGAPRSPSADPPRPVQGAPTPSPAADVPPSSATRTGIASWYSDGPGLYVAVRSWRWGDRPYQVRVCRLATCIVVTVRDHCGCPDGRLTDLSPEAFRRLAPLSAGLVRVGVEGLR